MGYYLLENRNPNGDHFYTSRRAKLRVIVLHITAGLEDLDMSGRDVSAEQTARYAATTDREVSWHAGADSDSWLSLLPASYTAWHASNYNSISWGLEISKRDTTWSDEPEAWVEATLRNAAAACRPVAETYGIPLRLLTRAQVDAGMSGFTYHMWLDPTRRSDPGKDFPIKRFFALMRGEEEDDMSEVMDWLKREFRPFTLKDDAGKEYKRTWRQAVIYGYSHSLEHRKEGRTRDEAIAKAVAANAAALKAIAEQHQQIQGLPELVAELDASVDKLASLPLATALVLREDEPEEEETP